VVRGQHEDSARGSTADPRAGGKRSWRDSITRLKGEVAKDRLSIVSAGVAFYALLAAFPALAALIAIYGLVFDPQQVVDQVQGMSGFIPPQAAELLVGQLQELARADRGALGLGAAGGLLLALWSASAGVRTLMEALNVAYGEEEKRGFFKRTGLSLLLTLGVIAGAILAIACVVLLPAVIDFLGLGSTLEGLLYYARWPILAAAFWIGLRIIYRYGPSRGHPRPAGFGGPLLVTVLWLAGSLLFSWYVENFGNYNKTYGSMAAVVVLLMWLLLSAYAVLIGAEIDAEGERREREAAPEPGRGVGRRDAYPA
jgi:membrane protein